jgi:transposase
VAQDPLGADWLHHRESPTVRRAPSQRAQIGSRAWATKDSFRHIWDYQSTPAARAFFERWQAWAVRARLKPMIHVAGIVRRHLDNILYRLNQRITNAVTEGLNAKFQWIKYASSGFRNRERFKPTIYFHRGGLDLDPR